MPFYKDASGNTYRLDSKEFEPTLPTGCVEITEAEVTVIRQSRTPPPAPLKPIEQIRAKEQAQNVRDAMERASRMASLLSTRAEMVRQMGAKTPPVVITHDQAHAWLVVNDKYYKLLWEVEQEIEPLRKLVT